MASSGGRWLVAVHVGAGYHAPAKQPLYLALIRSVLADIGGRLSRGEQALRCAAMAVSQLEMHGWCNRVLRVCGRRLRNPSLVAERLLQEGATGLLPDGRLAPMMLAGPGAAAWAASRGFEVDPRREFLVTAAASERRLALLQQLEDARTGAEQQLDTVGAVCLDVQGHLAAAVSSGGPSLKTHGRVGHAALFGAGCWAQDAAAGKAGVAVSASGAGEEIACAMLAYRAAAILLSEGSESHSDDGAALSALFEGAFLRQPHVLHAGGFRDARHRGLRLAGLIALCVGPAAEGRLGAELLWSHSTTSFALGYYSSAGGAVPAAFVSRLEPGRPGSDVVHGGCFLAL